MDDEKSPRDVKIILRYPESNQLVIRFNSKFVNAIVGAVIISVFTSVLLEIAEESNNISKDLPKSSQ